MPAHIDSEMDLFIDSLTNLYREDYSEDMHVTVLC